jgi:hypothetical protein
MTDDSSRGLMGLADKLESSLRYAASDIDQSSLLTSRLVEENTKVSPLHECGITLTIGSI